MFEGLIGQQAVKDKLSRLIRRGAPGRAHLFLGAAGIGKRRFAGAYANALLCDSAVTTYDGAARETHVPAAVDSGADYIGRIPCGGCIACGLFKKGAFGEYRNVEPGGQSQKKIISVDAVRQITDWFKTRPINSRRKVCVIGNADHMTEQAQNALLKTLEEPPVYGAIILTAANPGMLLETVRSRCETTYFTSYTENELINIIKNSPECPQESKILPLARVSEGNPGKAFELASSDTFFSLRDELLRLFCGHIDGDARSTVFLAAFLEKNRERFIQFSGIMIRWLRDIWLLSIRGAPDNELKTAAADMADKLESYRARYKPAALLECIECIDGACSAITANANFSLAVNAMLFEINALLPIYTGKVNAK